MVAGPIPLWGIKNFFWVRPGPGRDVLTSPVRDLPRGPRGSPTVGWLDSFGVYPRAQGPGPKVRAPHRGNNNQNLSKSIYSDGFTCKKNFMAPDSTKGRPGAIPAQPQKFCSEFVAKFFTGSTIAITARRLRSCTVCLGFCWFNFN